MSKSNILSKDLIESVAGVFYCGWWGVRYNGGRYDGENYDVGLFDVADIPNENLVRTAEE
jgi:hypothetical protein